MSPTIPRLPAPGPWANGPAEILSHAAELLRASDDDRRRRIAMILTDNAVEQMLKTYLGLPERATGLKLTRKAQETAFQSWPALMNLAELHIEPAFVGIEVADVEWCHRVRNDLYHSGAGLTASRQIVDTYYVMAAQLMKRLFGNEVEESSTTPGQDPDLLGRFMMIWHDLERLVNEAGGSTSKIVDRLTDDGAAAYSQARDLRNRAVHAQLVVGSDELRRMEGFAELLESELQELAGGPVQTAAVIDLAAALEASVNAAKEARGRHQRPGH